MKRSKSRRMVLVAMALPVVALLGYAWVDGGRQPLHDMDESLPIPGAHK